MKKIRLIFIALFAINTFLFAQEQQTKDLTVENAVSLAKENNVNIKRQQLSLELLKQKNDYSWNSVSPSASLSANIGKTFGETESSSWSVSGSLSLSLTPSLYTSIINANLNYQNGLATFEQTQKTIEVNVRKLFFNLLCEKSRLQLQKNNLETLRQRYNSNYEKYRKGQLSELDLLTSQYNYESQKPTVETAIINYENSIQSFKLLIGLEQDADINLVGDLKDYVVTKEINYEFDINKVPSIQTMQRQVEIAKNNLLSTRFSAYGPSITASYSYGKSGTFESDLERTTNQLSVGVRLPLDGLLPWSSGALGVNSQKANLEDLELQLKNQKDTTKLEIETNIKKIKQTQQQVELLKSNVSLAQKTYNATYTAYTHGSRDLLTLKNSQDALLSAQINLELQRYNLICAVLDLENSLGIPFGTLGAQ